MRWLYTVAVFGGLVLVILGYASKSYGSLFVGIWIVISQIFSHITGIDELIERWGAKQQIIFLVGYVVLSLLIYIVGSRCCSVSTLRG